MTAPLDPQRLTPAASLNRVMIVDLPGLDVDAGLVGRTALDLLSAPALVEALLTDADALGLDATERSNPGALPPLLDRCLASSDPQVRAAAERIARRFGRRLGYIILALRRGDAANRAARPDCDASYWDHWSRVGRIWLGGGRASGRTGPALLRAADALLREAGMDDCALDLADAPAHLPLIGAARSVPPGARRALVLDFGHSYIKRAIAGYTGAALTSLRSLPPLPAPHIDTAASDAVQSLAEALVDALVDSWRAAQEYGDLALAIVASVASYIADNHPLPRQSGLYAQTYALGDNLGRWLARRAGQRLSRAVTVTLLHDGSAAARTYAGAHDAAVIMLGTSLGIGFPPSEEGLRPVAARLDIRAF